MSELPCFSVEASVWSIISVVGSTVHEHRKNLTLHLNDERGNQPHLDEVLVFICLKLVRKTSLMSCFFE